MNNVTCFYYTSAPVVTGLPVTLNQHRLDNNEVGGHVCSSDVSVLRKLKTKQRKVLWFQQLKWFVLTNLTLSEEKSVFSLVCPTVTIDIMLKRLFFVVYLVQTLFICLFLTTW